MRQHTHSLRAVATHQLRAVLFCHSQKLLAIFTRCVAVSVYSILHAIIVSFGCCARASFPPPARARPVSVVCRSLALLECHFWFQFAYRYSFFLFTDTHTHACSECDRVALATPRMCLLFLYVFGCFFFLSNFFRLNVQLAMNVISDE